MKNIAVILTSLFFFPFFSSAQSKPFKRWAFSLSAGAAIPVGVYGKTENATIYSTDQYRRFIGLDKSKSGFAKIGHYYNAAIQFHLNQNVILLLRSGKLINSVHTQELSDHLSALFDGRVKAEHDKYNVSYFALGIGYHKSFNKFNLGLDLFTGFTNSNYPYYEGILLYTTTTPPLNWAQDGPQPKLNALMMGSSLHFSHNISPVLAVGVDLMYQRADFDYVIATRIIPGYDISPAADDIIKLRVLNTGFRIGYMF